MTIEVEENDYTCGTCKHYDNVNNEICFLGKDWEKYKSENTCGGWEEDKDELTDDEKREIVGDRKAHEIMETEGG